MIAYLVLIFGCQLIGELTVRALDLPVPGPVIGMVLLFLFLMVRGHVPKDLASVADGILNHLSLLFVPAGVGVMLHFGLLGDDWLAIGTALIISTMLTIATTALLMAWLNKPVRKSQPPDGAG